MAAGRKFRALVRLMEEREQPYTPEELPGVRRMCELEVNNERTQRVVSSMFRAWQDTGAMDPVLVKLLDVDRGQKRDLLAFYREYVLTRMSKATFAKAMGTIGLQQQRLADEARARLVAKATSHAALPAGRSSK